jgi:hypothetical protein
MRPLTHRPLVAQVTDPATNVTFRFNVCNVVTVQSGGDPACQAANGSVCQYEGTSLKAVNARWTPSDSTSFYWSLMDPSQPDTGVQLSFQNGDLCPTTGQPSTVSLIFPCTPGVPQGAIQVDADECDIDIYLPTSHACPPSIPPPLPGNCTYVLSSGLAYDFSPLTLTDGFYSATDSAGYNYSINVCAPLPQGTQPSLNCGNGANVCQYTNAGQFVAIVARWTAAQSGTWSNSVLGPRLNFADGDICFPNGLPRTATIQFVCSRNLVGHVTVGNGASGCDYQIKFPTKLACK